MTLSKYQESDILFFVSVLHFQFVFECILC